MARCDIESSLRRRRVVIILSRGIDDDST